jgi:hypothetical protein
MKKLLVIVVGVFSLFSSSSMVRPCRQKLNEYMSSYNSHRDNAPFDYVPIDSAIIKNALLEEIGNDEHARKAYKLFQEGNYQELLKYLIKNNAQMDPDNAQRFKEMLIWATSIVATKTDFDCWETWTDPWKEGILCVVGDRGAVTKKTFQHLRFCYELMFGKLVDIGEDGDNFHESHFCNCITFHWRENPIKCFDTGDVVGCVEWLDEYCYPCNIWPRLEND